MISVKNNARIILMLLLGWCFSGITMEKNCEEIALNNLTHFLPKGHETIFEPRYACHTCKRIFTDVAHAEFHTAGKCVQTSSITIMGALDRADQRSKNCTAP